jgi:hypothetical protein
MGSHIHRMAFRSPISVEYSEPSDDDLKVFATPSFSPIYDNNPGFTTLSIKDSKIHAIKLHFF